MKTRRSHFETRYLVLNTAASTLELEHAQLLAVAAVVVENGSLRSHDSLLLDLDHPAASITADLQQLVELSANSVLVVFNAAFNRSLISKACETHLPQRPPWDKHQRWLDLYFLLPALFPERRERPVRLHSWMESFAIEAIEVKDSERALADAWAIAQLLLAALARGNEMGAATANALIEIERTHRQYRGRI